VQKTGFFIQRQQHIGWFCLSLTSLLFVSLLDATPARACACCSDPGMRFEAANDIDQYEKDVLGQVRFDDTAQLFLTPAFPEDIKGIVAPSDKPYQFRGITGPKRWTFELSDSAGKQGTIVFPLPRRLVRFMVDPRDEEATSAGGGPRLYKEWRLASTADLSGLVAENEDKAQATLILHGHGNGCTAAEDFTHWTLQVSGPDVTFTLLGKLKKPK
jgi:hypothetical protein